MVNQKVKYWARKCDITGEGMNEGYCIEDGIMYIKNHKDMHKHLREIDGAKQSKSEEQLFMEYYENFYYYWTEWEDEEEYQYKEINGKLIEL